VVELFRAVKQEKQLHREILAFSVSHDHRLVRIYGHYPVIEDQKTTFYRPPHPRVQLYGFYGCFEPEIKQKIVIDYSRDEFVGTTLASVSKNNSRAFRNID
jgi:hypothetical protein